MAITVDRFLEGLKRSITNPANQILMGDDAMLDMADDATRDEIVPLLLSVNQNFFVVETSQVLTANQNYYDIPYRAVGRGLRDLKLTITGQADSTSNLTLVDLEDEHLFASTGIPQSFYFRGDQFVLVPTPTDTARYLRLWYDLQPSQLTQTANAAQITAVASNVFTCTTVPTTITTSTPCDIIKGKAGCSIRGMDITPTAVTSTTITFATADVPVGIVVGDWVALAQMTPVLQLPDEIHPLLESLTGSAILDAIGDTDGANSQRQRAVAQTKNALKVLTPRISGEQTKIVNRNGLLRGRGYNTWRLRSGF